MVITSQIPTMLLVILDESGSMSTKQADVIGGFNTFLKEQQENPAPCRLALTKFNTECTHIPIAPVSSIASLTKESYTPGGNTALFDAIAQTVRRVDAEKKDDEKVLCLVMTDGEENSSRETTSDQIKELIKSRSATGWTFLYIGEKPEKWAQAMGASPGSTTAYRHQAPSQNLSAASVAAASYRSNPMQDTKNLMRDAEQTADKKLKQEADLLKDKTDK